MTLPINDSPWNIQIVDNFLPKDIFHNVCTNIQTIEFGRHHITYGVDDDVVIQPGMAHIFFSRPISHDDDFIRIVRESLKKKCKTDIKKVTNAAWILVNTKDPLPHVNQMFRPKETHMLIYLTSSEEKDSEKINSGTGFYLENSNGDQILNSHIGFRENRAIIFDSKIYHTSLQFNKDSSGVRYVMANFLNYKPGEKIK